MEGLSFKPPTPLSFSGNVSLNWKKFRQQFEIFLVAFGGGEMKDDRKLAMLLNVVGEEGLEVYNTFTIKEDEKEKYKAALSLFEQFCSPKGNVIFERFVFNNVIQKEGQNIDAFVTELKTKVKTCEYDKPDDMVRDRLVLGVKDKSLQERLLRESDLTLEKAISLSKSLELSKLQVKKLLAEETASSLDLCSSALSKVPKEKEPLLASGTASAVVSATSATGRFGGRVCWRCDSRHEFKKCPAFDSECFRCKRKGHFAKMCKVKTINEVSDKGEFYFIDTLFGEQECLMKSSKNAVWKKSIFVNNMEVDFKLDTGAEISCLPYNLYERLASESDCVRGTRITLRSYGSPQFTWRPKGEVNLWCVNGNYRGYIKFVLVETLETPLLGLDACLKLNLIRRMDNVEINKCYNTYNSLNDLKNKFKTVFEGLGKFPQTHHITIDKSISPKIHPIRRVPLALHERLRNKLSDLEKRGVIRKVTKPTDWLNPLVIIEKPNGDLRLCIDSRDINKAIRREHYLIPTIDDIAIKLGNNKFFTVLDMKDGYLQVPIDDESADLCTFATPFGRYQFLRLPFGLTSSCEVFQKMNYDLFGHLPGVNVYFDDIIITGGTEEEHDARLSAVLGVALKNNIKFNPEKIQFKKGQVKFMGHVFSKDGVSTDKDYTRAILEFPTPQDKKDILRLLGLAKYLSKYIPNLSAVTAPLRKLTSDKVNFEWNEDCDKAFVELKKLIVGAPVLSIFDPRLGVLIQTDASRDGLGACLIQSGRPVAFVSRSLNVSEQRYAQIEKEMLAIVFACEKFHTFIYGHGNVVLNTDHKPLINLTKKDLDKISPRLQRMLLKIINYNLKLEYLPGKELVIADTLSRAAMIGGDNDSAGELEVCLDSLVTRLAMSEKRKFEFRKETEADKELIELINFINKGWPNEKRNVPVYLLNYWKCREDLSVAQGLVFLGSKVVVPKILRGQMLMLLHEGHLGMEKTKNRARQILYWPGINSDIENFISNCKICEKFSMRNCKQPLLPYPLPDRPWKRVGCDIFSIYDHSYLVLYDAYSNWLEVAMLKDKSVRGVIWKFKSIFSKYGVPDVIVCDNVPFNSYELKNFATQWNFDLVFRSPNYPQANGLAEKGVAIAKDIVKKSVEEGKDVYVSLMQYRNSPLKQHGFSPAQLFFNRILRTKLPICENLLKSKVNKIEGELIEKRDIQKRYYDRNCKLLPEINLGDSVGIWDPRKKYWVPGKVIRLHLSPRSFIVKDIDGRVMRRNRRDLKLLKRDCHIPDDNYLDHENECSNENIFEKCKSPVKGSPAKENLLTTRSGREVRPPERLQYESL